jgi:hypothetical protein
MRVYVNQSDIDQAEALRSSPKLLNYSCPLWHTLVRITGEKVSVGTKVITIGQAMYITTDDGDEFIRNFDKGLTVYPTHVTLAPLGTALERVRY